MERAQIIQMLREKLGQAVGELENPSPEWDQEGWKVETLNLLEVALGEEDRNVKDFGAKPRGGALMGTVGGQLLSTHPSRPSELRGKVALLKAALLKLDVLTHQEPLLDEALFDSELWGYVAPNVANEQWDQVATLTAVFFENWVRTRTAASANPKGGLLVGRGLMAKTFSDSGSWRLGSSEGEYEGWRALAIGFSLAIGNVDRHALQERSDIKRYALGVMGVASLIMTQIRHQHGERLEVGEPVKAAEGDAVEELGA